jgi:PAS domain S-box-containing protein
LGWRLKNALLEAALKATRDGVVVADALAEDMPIVYANPSFEAMTGYTEAELLGRNCRFLQGEDRRQRAVTELREAIEDGRACEVLLRNYRKDGSLFWNQLNLQPFEEQGRVRWWIGIATDVGALHDLKDRLRNRQRALAEARASAPDDRLTGLRSRVFFDQALEREWHLCVRESRTLNLFLFSIDHVRQYLDTFGRRAGDSCLRQVARGIRGAYRRSSDVCARYDDWRVA